MPPLSTSTSKGPRVAAAIASLMLSGGLCSASLPAGAMDYFPQGEQLLVTGRVGTDEYARFTDVLAANPQTKTVVAVNCLGGSSWAGLAIARTIMSKGLDTVTVGKAASSCSIIFMAGAKRQFSDAWSAGGTFVGIHGASFAGTGELNLARNPEFNTFYKQRMGDKYHAAIMDAALYDMKNRYAMLYIYDSVRNSKDLVVHCNDSTLKREDCKRFEGVDAFSLGIINDKELVKVVLPDALRSKRSIRNNVETTKETL
jgi:hypothetical protein